MDLPPAEDEGYSRETREAPPAHLVTKIKSFSMLSKHEIGKLELTEFESGDYKWKVVINLDGDEHISVNLSMVGTSSLPAGWEVNVFFNFFLYNHITDKYLCFRGKARRLHAINPECGFSKLIAKNSLTQPSNGYLHKDKCVFGAEVFVIKNQPLIQKVSVLSLSTPYKREWSISKFSKLESIWNSEVFSARGYKWQVMMFPNGMSKTSGLYVAVRLECVDSKRFGDKKKLNVACTFCFRNKLNDNKHHTKKATMLYTSTAPSWGINDFQEIENMRDRGKGFVVDDCCIFEIQLSVQALHKAPCIASH